MSRVKRRRRRFFIWVALIGAILFFMTHWAVAMLAVIILWAGYLIIFNDPKQKESQPYVRKTKPPVKQNLDLTLNESNGLLKLEDLLTILEVERSDEKTFPKRSLDQVITILNGFGYGVVPNYQLGHRRLTYGDVCVVYRLPVSFYNLKSSRMRDKEMFFKLLSIVIGGEGLSAGDLEYVRKCIASQHLANEFQGHFIAYIFWLSQKKQPFDKKTKDDLALMPATIKQTYAKLLLNSVYVNGEIDSNRVEVLKKILPFLGFEAESVHSLLHQTLTDESGFTPTGHRQDVQRQESPMLDMSKLNELQQQTKAAQELLSEIFVEEEEAPKPDLPKKENSIVAVLAKLLEKEVWTRDEVKEMVGASVMIGNLLEEINDYSYSKVDDIVVEEDGDQIYVTTEYKNQLI